MRLSEHQTYGLHGERWVLAQLTGRGFSAALLSNFFEDIDIVVNGLLRVEVKTARPRLHQTRPGQWRRRWQFDLSRLPNPKREDYAVICVADTGAALIPFVFPSALLHPMGRRCWQLTSHPDKYNGWAAAYRERWDLITVLLEKRQQQAGQLVLPLFAPLGHTERVF